MKNFVQPGNTVTFIAPTSGVSSGDGVLFGALFGVAATDADASEEYEAQIVGVFDLAKDGNAIDAGEKVFWNGAACTATVGATLIGACVADAGSGAATVKVRLNGTTV